MEGAYTLDTGGWLCCCTRLTWLCLETSGALSLSPDLVRLTNLREMRLSAPSSCLENDDFEWGRLQDPPMGSFPLALTSLSMVWLYMGAVPHALAGISSSLQRLELFCCQSFHKEGEQAMDCTPAARVLSALTALTVLGVENFGYRSALPAEIAALQQLRALSWSCVDDPAITVAEMAVPLGRLSSLSALKLRVGHWQHETDVLSSLLPGQLRLLHLERTVQLEADVQLLGGLQSLALPLSSFIHGRGALARLPQLRHLLLLCGGTLDANEQAQLGPALLELQHLPRLEELGLEEDEEAMLDIWSTPISRSALTQMMAARPALRITKHVHSHFECPIIGCHWSI